MSSVQDVLPPQQARAHAPGRAHESGTVAALFSRLKGPGIGSTFANESPCASTVLEARLRGRGGSTDPARQGAPRRRAPSYVCEEAGAWPDNLVQGGSKGRAGAASRTGFRLAQQLCSLMTVVLGEALRLIENLSMGFAILLDSVADRLSTGDSPFWIRCQPHLSGDPARTKGQSSMYVGGRFLDEETAMFGVDFR